jgi:hypothetical protein
MLKKYRMGPYEFTSASDKGEPKTVFVMRPLSQFEYMRMSGLFANLVKRMNPSREGGMDEFLAFFASDEGERFRLEYEMFLRKKVAEIKNIQSDDGVAINITEPDKILEAIPPMVAFEILSDAIGRVNVSEEEKGN